MWRVRHGTAEFCVWRARGVEKVCFASFGVPAAALAASGSAAIAPAAYVARSRRETSGAKRAQIANRRMTQATLEKKAEGNKKSGKKIDGQKAGKKDVDDMFG